MTDEQQRPLGAHARKRVERLPGAKAARERRVQLERIALGVAHLSERQLSGFARARLRAREHRAERHSGVCQRQTRDTRLALAALGEPPLCVGTRAVRLRVGVTEQPELTGHSHGVLRA